MKRNYPANKRSDNNDTVFAVGEEKSSGWLIDSEAIFHMTPHRKDLFDYKGLEASIEVTIADGKKLLVNGSGTVKLTGLDGKGIRMVCTFPDSTEVTIRLQACRAWYECGVLAVVLRHLEQEASDCVRYKSREVVTA